LAFGTVPFVQFQLKPIVGSTGMANKIKFWRKQLKETGMVSNIPYFKNRSCSTWQKWQIKLLFSFYVAKLR
jgi:hypothetical protein